MSKRNWNKLYRTYERDYARSELKGSSTGGKGKFIKLSDKLTFDQFKIVYSGIENDAIEERNIKLAAGKKVGKSLNVQRKVIDAQKELAYEYSEAQFKAIQKAYNRTFTGEKVSQRDIMIGAVDLDKFWKAVEAQNELHKLNPTVMGTASQVIFGSP